MIELVESRQGELRKWFGNAPSISYNDIHRLGHCSVHKLDNKELRKYAREASKISDAYKRLEVILSIMFLALEATPNDLMTEREELEKEKKEIMKRDITDAMKKLGIE